MFVQIKARLQKRTTTVFCRTALRHIQRKFYRQRAQCWSKSTHSKRMQCKIGMAHT